MIDPAPYIEMLKEIGDFITCLSEMTKLMRQTKFTFYIKFVFYLFLGNEFFTFKNQQNYQKQSIMGDGETPCIS